jgi:CheY-like chemotaxis protein
VLVADDNRDFADSLAVVLERAGHQVQVTYDGASALRAAAAGTPEVALFDIGMPGLDGYALAESIRRQPGGRDCLLVAITGWGQEGDKQLARSAGFDHHMVKPVDMEALLRLMEPTA